MPVQYKKGLRVVVNLGTKSIPSYWLGTLTQASDKGFKVLFDDGDIVSFKTTLKFMGMGRINKYTKEISISNLDKFIEVKEVVPPIKIVPGAPKLMKGPRNRKIGVPDSKPSKEGKKVTNKEKSSILENTWTLKEKLSEIPESPLKKSIQRYIKLSEEDLDKNALETGSFMSLIYRGNLSYILDNIEKKGLIDEIKKLLLSLENSKVTIDSKEAKSKGMTQDQIKEALKKGKTKIDWSKVTSKEAQTLLDNSLGMDKALRDKLWTISRNPNKRKIFKDIKLLDLLRQVSDRTWEDWTDGLSHGTFPKDFDILELVKKLKKLIPKLNADKYMNGDVWRVEDPDLFDKVHVKQHLFVYLIPSRLNRYTNAIVSAKWEYKRF